MGPRAAGDEDLELRRHYAGEREGPLADVISVHADFFALFHGFMEFMEFLHLQDLVTPDYTKAQFYLPFDDFGRPGTPATTHEYVMYREMVLKSIEKRSRRMAEWVRQHHPKIEVRQ